MSHQQVLGPPGQVQQLAVLCGHPLEQALHPLGVEVVPDLRAQNTVKPEMGL